MIKYTLLAVICAVATVVFSAAVVKRQAQQSGGNFSPDTYILSAGADEVLGQNIKYTFTCKGKPYGYYADMDNDCKIFHICLPVPDLFDPDTAEETYIFSFFCGNQTIFNQEKLVCVHDNPEQQDLDFKCEESYIYYMINENFGKQVWHTTPRSVEEEKRKLG